MSILGLIKVKRMILGRLFYVCELSCVFYNFGQIKSFIDYLKRVNHPKPDKFLMAAPKIIQMEWRTNNNISDCGVFVMRHMETYMGGGAFCQDLKKLGIGQSVQIKLLRVKYVAKIILMEINEAKQKFLKEAEAYVKTILPTNRIITQEYIKVPPKLFERISKRVKKVFNG